MMRGAAEARLLAEAKMDGYFRHLDTCLGRGDCRRLRAAIPSSSA